ncbi:MAG: alpha/beta hydrolase [Bacteroidales bacterium]|nr:alpha/beta hydrolase [Bacteroidales bacterium]
MRLSFRTALTICMLAITSLICSAQEKVITPSVTCTYAHRDTCDLYMDIYNPAPGSVTSIDGVAKPAIIFVFGGGFVMGERNNEAYLPWYKMLTDEGYKVIAIDYRLGLKGVKGMGVKQVRQLDKAIHLAVEDVFSAVSFLIQNSARFDIQPDNIVLSGSSAGAITALQADWECANRTEYTKELPEGFRFAGIMSFSGAIYSDKGVPKYQSAPAPTLMLHGTDDQLVPYTRIKFLNLIFAGSDVLAKAFLENGYNLNIYRFKGRGHEIANNMVISFPDEIRFLETNVMRKEKRIVDAMVDDPSIPTPSWARATASDIYK